MVILGARVAHGRPRDGLPSRRIRAAQRISVRDEAITLVARGGSCDHSPGRRCDRAGADSSGRPIGICERRVVGRGEQQHRYRAVLDQCLKVPPIGPQ